jgi:hypothetical protein
MGAPLGFKTFTTGDVLTAADTNGYLMQGVWTFASAAARDAAVTSPQEGNVCYLKDTDAVMTYSGSAWVAVGGTPTLSGCSITRTNVSTAISAGTEYVVLFPTENFDTNTYHDTATNTSRITVPAGKGGKYLVSAWVWNALGTPGSYQLMRLKVNGAQYTSYGNREGEFARTTAVPELTGTSVINLSAGDYLELGYQQQNAETVNFWFVFSAIYLGA